jgi:hypothetical protein
MLLLKFLSLLLNMCLCPRRILLSVNLQCIGRRCSLPCFILSIILINMGSRYNVWSTFQGKIWMFKCTSVLMTLSHHEEISMKPSYMSIKKALHGRQPCSFFFGFVFFALAREFFLVFFLCTCCTKRVSFSLFIVANNKFPSFIYLRCFKVAIHMGSC